MELRHLRYFVAVAEELHFGRAAQRLHVAQPPLSQQIRSLEGWLGVTLFKRSSRRVELTAEGRVFLEHARLVLMHAGRAAELVRAASRGEAGSIGIGFVTSAVYSLVPSILREFHRLRPNVEIRCSELLTLDLLQALHNQEIDVGFIRMPVREPGIATMRLVTERLVLALPSDNPHPESKPVRLTDHARDSFIFLARDVSPSAYDVMLSACRAAGFSPRLTQEVGEWQTGLALVAAGLGVAVVPESMSNWQRPGVIYRSFTPNPARIDLLLAWRRDATDARATEFVQVAKAVAANTPPMLCAPETSPAPVDTPGRTARSNKA